MDWYIGTRYKSFRRSFTGLRARCDCDLCSVDPEGFDLDHEAYEEATVIQRAVHAMGV